MLAVAVCALAALLGWAGNGPVRSLAAVPASTAQGPCRGAPAPSRLRHVIVLVLENHSYSQILGSSSAPNLNRLASSCGVASNYHSISHPSLPNYLALTAGSTFGLATDVCHCSLAVGGVFRQMALSGQRWGVYAESMPRACWVGSTSALGYTSRHNPPVYFRPLWSSCRAHDRRLGVPTSGPLDTALRDGSLPAYSLIVPNLCNDMHNCSISTSDAWVGRWVRRIQNSYAYQRQPTAIFILWDEGTGGHIGAGENCASHLADQSCHVPLIVVSRFVRPGTAIRAYFTHYSLLRAIEVMLHVRPLRRAATAPRGLASAFHL